MPLRAKSYLRQGTTYHPVVEPLEDRWLLDGSPLTAAVRLPALSPVLLATAPRPEVSFHSADHLHLVPGPASGHEEKLIRKDFADAPPATPGEHLPGKGVAEHGKTDAGDSIFLHLDHSGDFPTRGKLMPVGTRHEEFLPAGESFPSPEAAGVTHRPPRPSLSQEDAISTRDGFPPGTFPGIFRRFATPRPADPSAKGEETPPAPTHPSAEERAKTPPPPKEDAVSSSIPSPQGDSGGRPVDQLLSQVLSATTSPGTARAWTSSSDPSGGSEHPGHGGRHLVPPVEILAAVRAPAGFGSSGGDVGATPSRARGEPSARPGEPEAPGLRISTPGSLHERVIQTDLSPSPQGASLLTEGVTTGLAALERAVRALVEPMREMEGRPSDMLFWLCVTSWLLAAALACEVTRRSLARRSLPGSTFSAVPSDFLPEEHP